MDRVNEAVSLFEEGYNCCQSVFAAFSDRYGLDRETALKISASFGGGMGRMREVCGTVSGMALVCGLETGSTDGRDSDAKKHNYEVMRELADRFRENNGTIICRELLGLDRAPQSARPEERTADYYKKRPCKRLVQEAAEILTQYFEMEAEEVGK